MKQAVWIGSKPITQEQKDAIYEQILQDDVEIVSKEVEWSVSDNFVIDTALNMITWAELQLLSPCVLGDFPLIALECVPAGMSLLVPLEKDGKHLRWIELDISSGAV